MKEFKRCNVSTTPILITCGVRATLRLLRFRLFLFLTDPRMTQSCAYSIAARTVCRHRRQSGGTLAILWACCLTQRAGTPTLAPASRCHTRVQVLERSEESIALRPLAPHALQVIAGIGAKKTRPFRVQRLRVPIEVCNQKTKRHPSGCLLIAR
jgi:hypothetical protein